MHIAPWCAYSTSFKLIHLIFLWSGKLVLRYKSIHFSRGFRIAASRVWVKKHKLIFLKLCLIFSEFFSFFFKYPHWIKFLMKLLFIYHLHLNICWGNSHDLSLLDNSFLPLSMNHLVCWIFFLFHSYSNDLMFYNCMFQLAGPVMEFG